MRGTAISLYKVGSSACKKCVLNCRSSSYKVHRAKTTTPKLYEGKNSPLAHACLSVRNDLENSQEACSVSPVQTQQFVYVNLPRSFSPSPNQLVRGQLRAGPSGDRLWQEALRVCFVHKSEVRRMREV
jgi:hypothetical protein